MMWWLLSTVLAIGRIRQGFTGELEIDANEQLRSIVVESSGFALRTTTDTRAGAGTTGGADRAQLAQAHSELEQLHNRVKKLKVEEDTIGSIPPEISAEGTQPAPHAELGYDEAAEVRTAQTVGRSDPNNPAAPTSASLAEQHDLSGRSAGQSTGSARACPSITDTTTTNEADCNDCTGIAAQAACRKQVLRNKKEQRNAQLQAAHKEAELESARQLARSISAAASKEAKRTEKVAVEAASEEQDETIKQVVAALLTNSATNKAPAQLQIALSDTMLDVPLSREAMGRKLGNILVESAPDGLRGQFVAYVSALKPAFGMEAVSERLAENVIRPAFLQRLQVEDLKKRTGSQTFKNLNTLISTMASEIVAKIWEQLK